MTSEDPLIYKMRKSAEDGMTTIDILRMVYDTLATDSRTPLPVQKLFRDAFYLTVGDILPLGGTSVFGRKGYTDQEINQLLDMRIKETRAKWGN